jgi:hypothetical protein
MLQAWKYIKRWRLYSSQGFQEILNFPRQAIYNSGKQPVIKKHAGSIPVGEFRYFLHEHKQLENR